MNRIAFLFAGQGAQYTGMMKDLADHYQTVKELFDLANQELERDIYSLCVNGPQEELNLTHNTQPCVYIADMAAFTAISTYEIKPEAVAGFSLGEYAALTAAGVIDVKSAISLVQKRADYMQEAVPLGAGAMAAVMKISAEQVENLCSKVNGYVVPVNYNCPGQTVVAGETEAVDELIRLAKEQKAKAVKLPVSAPFHCRMMREAAEKLKGPLDAVQINIPQTTIYMNVDAQKENDPQMIREKLIRQAMSPVLWEATVRHMRQEGINTFVELGPGKTLSGLLRRTFADENEVSIFHVEDMESLELTVSELTRE